MNDLDSCFRISDERVTVAEALARFSKGIKPATGIERIPTSEALGRVLAQDLCASQDTPPHDNSAVDGYAVYFDDLNAGAETRLRVTGRIAAGHPLNRAARRGEAVQIFTGAPMPLGQDGDGPDTVFMVEDCNIEGEVVILPAGIKLGANRRRAGEDVKAGAVVLKAGGRLRAQEIAMAASLGLAEIEVRARLRVGVFSTGDEVREPGTALDAGCIYDANRYALMAMLGRLGADVTDMGIFKDNRAEVEAGLAAAAADYDLLMTSGGVSKGEEDHVRAAIDSLGAVNSWNLAIKPGRPMALGHISGKGRDTPFIGLPGNPVAVMVTFLRIARPIVLLLQGARAVDPAFFKVAADFDYDKKPGRREWLRAALAQDADGNLCAAKYPDDGSGIISSMVAADGLVELAEDLTQIRKGALVDFLPFSEVMS
ncbi:MAG: molybdopterin molybdotransferase MoeA [Rhodospirillales bacterium]|nr:molybdopterin molybdotransferase MoeA [Rhodospirillales bacterium]